MSDPGPALALGLAVFPLLGRRPARPGWAYAASADPRMAWLWPEFCNIGIGCRASNVVVLDLDRRDDRDGIEALAALCRDRGETLPETLSVQTPRGWHLYFRPTPGRLFASGRLTAGIDVRGPGLRSGGYVVGPGSVVGEHTYQAVMPRPIASLPQWLAELLPGRPIKMMRAAAEYRSR
ncbi:bifunctional DNA primase/polymerase [Nocardia sp. NPDC003963]